MNTNFNILDFWERIKELSKKKGLTQKELSKKIGCEPRLIETQIYNKFIPDIVEVLALSQALEESIYFLIYGNEKNPEIEKLKNKISRIIEICGE